jgi:hypothetical protein
MNRTEESPLQVLSQHLQIEISTGTFAPLRGARETLAAVKDGNVDLCECGICCSTQLICITDTAYVLCLECKVVNLLQLSPPKQGPFNTTGVGLGMTFHEYTSLVEQKIYLSYQQQCMFT